MQDKFIIITDNKIKENYLKNNHNLEPITFYSLKGFIKEFYGYLKKEAYKYLHDNYNYDYFFIESISNIFSFIDLNQEYKNEELNKLRLIKKDLINNELYKQNEVFKSLIKNRKIKIVNQVKTKLLAKLITDLKKLTEVIIIDDYKEYPHKEIKVYLDQESELRSAFNYICHDLKNIALNKIHFVNLNDSYLSILKRLSSNYKIPLNMKSEFNITTTKDIKYFLNNLDLNIEELLNNIKPEFAKIIVDIVNEYELDINKLANYKELLTLELKKHKYNNIKYEDAINISEELSFYEDDEYVFLFDFNQNYPKMKKEDGYLTDVLKEELGLDSTESENDSQINYLQQLIKNVKNLELSMPKMEGGINNSLSFLNNELNYKLQKINEVSYGYSKLEDIISFSYLLDDYYNYNISSELLLKYDLTELNYLSYDNKFKPFTNDFILTHQPTKDLFLSYSSIKTYFLCPFYYYCERILKLNDFKANMQATLGTYAHSLLENSYNKDFNYEEVKELLVEKFSNKEKFYASLLDEVVKNLILFNQEFESQSDLKKYKLEEEFKIFLDGICFYGKIDKFYYLETEDTIYIMIVDYKTGADKPSLDNLNDGLNLQIPSYLYLINNYKAFSGKKIKPLGLFLQKVNVNLIDTLKDIEKERRKSFKFKGYVTNNKEDLVKIDKTFNNSDYIESLKTLNSGEFAKYSKVFDDNDIESMLALMPQLLNKVLEATKNFNFPIKPLILDKTNISCAFCPYNNICFKTPKDNYYLKKDPFKKDGETNVD